MTDEELKDFEERLKYEEAKCADLEARLATSRAVALEEAARRVAEFFSSPDVRPLLSLNAALLVADLRALAALPPTLVVVERETIEAVKATLRSESWFKGDGERPKVTAVLAMLERVR